MSFHLPAPSSSGSQPSTSQSRMPVAYAPGHNKRSFEEYGHNNDEPGVSSQLSGTATAMSQPMATSSMGDAPNVLGLDTNSDVRYKRRRNSQSGSNGAANGLASSPLPASGFTHILNPPSTAERSMQGPNDAFVPWNSEPPAQSSAINPPESGHPSTGGVSSSISRILARSLNPSDGWNGHQSASIPAEDTTRNNRMSWISEVPSDFDTVTTNTEPGWDFASSGHNPGSNPNLGPSMPVPDAARDPPTSQNMYPSRETHSVHPTNSTRPSIQLGLTAFHHNVNRLPSPVTDYSQTITPISFPTTTARQNYSPITIPDFDEPMDALTRWPSPIQPSAALPSETTVRDGSNDSPWWPASWNYQEPRVPPPPTQSPPAPPHAASVQQANLPIPSETTVSDPSNSNHNPDSNPLPRLNSLQPPRPASSGWDFMDVSPTAAVTDEFSRYPYHLPSPTSEVTISTPLRDWPTAFSGLGASGGGSTGYHGGATHHHYNHSDSDSTMDLHRLLNRHTGLNSMDHLPDMTLPAPRTHERSFGPSVARRHPHNQLTPNQENSGGNRRVRFPDNVHHGPPSNRVVSPPPPNRRAPSLPFHNFFERHIRRSESEIPTSTSHHTRSASDGQNQTMPPPFPYQGPSRPRAAGEIGTSLAEDFYSISIPRHAPEPELEPFSHLGDHSSREPTPRPLGTRLRESIAPRRPAAYGHLEGSFTNSRERERHELDSFLNRPSQAPSSSRSNRPTLSVRSQLIRERSTFGLPSGSHRSNSPITPIHPPPPPPASNRLSRSLSYASSAPPVPRIPTPTPSSPSGTPPSPIHRLPFMADDSIPSHFSAGLSVRRSPRRIRAEQAFPWLEDAITSPSTPPPYSAEDEIGAPRPAAARSRLRSTRGPRGHATLPVRSLRFVGDYVYDDDFDDSYEGLLALEQLIGPAKKGCSDDSLKTLISGTFSKLVNEGKGVVGDDEQCPVCLGEYEKEQICTKLPRCSHIYHKDCIMGWLKNANTCPVCRESVEESSKPEVNPTTPPTRRSISGISRTRITQGLGQYLRDTSGPSTSTTSGGAGTQNSRRNHRRRPANDRRHSPPPSGVSGSRGSREGTRRPSESLSLDLGLSSISRPSALSRRYESGETSPSASHRFFSLDPIPSPTRINGPRFIRGPLTRWWAGETTETPNPPQFS